MDSDHSSAGKQQPPPSLPSSSPSPPHPPSSPLTKTTSSPATDHVFPIRSVISVDESQPTPCVHLRDPTDPDSFFPRRDLTWDGRSSASKSRAASGASVLTTSSLNNDRASTNPSRASQKVTTSPPTITITSDDDDGNDKTPPSHEQSPATTASSAPNQAAVDEFEDNAGQGRIGEAKSSPANGGDGQARESPITCTGEPNDPVMTTRFEHILTDDGHAIITGYHDTPQRCEDEPIHTPGAVQAFGLLVALKDTGDDEADSRFSVRIVSENSSQIIGYSPRELFQLESFMEIFSEEQADNLLDHIDFIRDEESDLAVSGADVFMVSLRPPGQSETIKLWCAMHVNSSHPDLIICEFEPEDDQRHPIRPPDELVPKEPEDTLYQSPTAEEFHQSTSISSKPLRVLRSAHRQRGEAGAMHIFNIMSQVLEQFASAPNLETFLKILVGIVKELTGFHRVMVYQFDAAFNGKVVAEVVNPSHSRDLFQGLHFPASDIPKQARDLYQLNRVRLLYDRELESARLVCRDIQELEKPLDLSHSYLRAISPIHLKYLGNMGVRSSMSISLNAFGELWGLIACHSYGPRGMRVSFPIRRMCRMVGEAASQSIERLSYASRLQARRLIINTMPTDKNPSGYITASSEDLLKLLDADFGMLSIGDETEVLGKVAQSQEALAMLEYLRLRNFTSVLTTQNISEDFPDLQYPPGFSVIAGLLYVPISVDGQDFIVFFRKAQVREVRWAGNPYEKTIRAGSTGLLEPRSSFKTWYETVVGQCREWSEEHIEAATVICLVYGKFINVWRQNETALQTSRLTRLLLANSAHEVRTPLNAIINYLEIAMEGSLDRETRDNLAKSHSASKSLIHVINDLLDLTKMEEGQELVKDEVMNLPRCISEAAEPFKVVAKRKGIEYEVVEHHGIPNYVHGDYRRVRQVVTNVAANAMQNTTTGFVKVEYFVIEVSEDRVRVEIMVHDTGRGMSREQLDNLFQDLEQVISAAPPDETKGYDDEGLDQKGECRTLGLGLAVVARIVRNMDGQLRVTSDEGKGSKFIIQLPFELANNAPDASDITGYPASDTKSLASVTRTPPPTEANEILLVDRGSRKASALSPLSLSRPRSLNEMKSTSSLDSGGSGEPRGNKSDNNNKNHAARLMDAIQTSFGLGEGGQEGNQTQRKDSEERRADTETSPNSDASQGKTAAVEPPQISLPTTPDTAKLSPSRLDIPHISSSQPRRKSFGHTPGPTSSPADLRYPLFGAPGKPGNEGGAKSSAKGKGRLRVLVAEDDPINMKILTKRLEKAGHRVHPVVNGEDCATVYRERPFDFDVILMDMQMPIIGGLASTKLIRAFEKSDHFPKSSSSPSLPSSSSSTSSTSGHSREHIPIFAVSASLVEREKPEYTEAGFDGWILKPINFGRLNILLEGINSEEVRERCLYRLGEWERGGWFDRREEEDT
ncbi:hsp90-like protein [Xylaria sp. CBS 124048]|nr:hsp90-like protein [Xylaria sp. CBS 124048]